MFASDNAAGVHPAIMDALLEANAGVAAGYGGDPWTKDAVAMLRAVFERDAAVLLTPTGTAANALALASLCPPWGAVVAHEHAHIVEDEAGAPEFFTGGAKMLTMPGPDAKLEPAALENFLARFSRDWVHGAQPWVVSISNLTECGAVYAPAEVAAIGAVCRQRGVKLHMDGARLANALIATGASAADMTWRAGVDVVSFGATKNGAMGLDVLVCFDETAATALPHLRKRAGHLLSKHRYLGAQLGAYLREGLWLNLAAHANAHAASLAQALQEKGATLVRPCAGNEVFAVLDEALEDRLRAAGVAFYAWAPDGPRAFRFVASWATSAEHIAVVRGA